MKSVVIRKWQQEYKNNESWRNGFDESWECERAGWDGFEFPENQGASLARRTKSAASLINRIKDGGKLNLDYAHISLQHDGNHDVIFFHDGKKNISMCAYKDTKGWLWLTPTTAIPSRKHFDNVYQLAEWINTPFTDEEVYSLLNDIVEWQNDERSSGRSGNIREAVLLELLKTTAEADPKSTAGIISNTLQAGVPFEDLTASMPATTLKTGSRKDVPVATLIKKIATFVKADLFD